MIVIGGAGALGKSVRDHFAGMGDRVAVIDVSDEIWITCFRRNTIDICTWHAT